MDVACPVTHEKLKLAFIQMRMKDFTHIPQLLAKGSASKCPEGSVSPFLKRATLQYLSIESTFGNGFRIQALLLSSFVCKCPEIWLSTTSDPGGEVRIQLESGRPTKVSVAA